MPLLTQEAARKIESDPANQCLQPAAIRRMMTDDGQPMSEQVRTVFGLFGVL